MKLLHEYITTLLMEVPLDDFGYVTPVKKDEPVIVKGELADYFKDIPQIVNVYIAHTDDLNWAQEVPSKISGQLPDHIHGRGVTQITDVGGVAKLYPQLAKEFDDSAINLLYVYSKTYLVSGDFVPDINPHYIAHDLHHIFELQNRKRKVGGVGEDKFKKIIKGYLDELLLATLGPHSDEYKAVSKSLGRIGRRFGVDKVEGRRLYSEIFPDYDFVSGDGDLLGDAFAAYLKSGKKIQLGIPTSWKGETGERKSVDRDIKIRNDAVSQAVASEWSKDLQDLLDTLMEPLVGKVGIFNIFQAGGKDKERAIESGKGAGRKKYPELFDYFDSQGAKFESFRDYDERGKALVVEFPHPSPGEDVWKVEEYASYKPDVVAKLGDLGFDIAEASTGFGFDREGINLYLIPKSMKEGLLRGYIRSLLVEKELRGQKDKRTMYHIGRRPASPKPAERWGEKGGWTRQWTDEPVASGVFLTGNPTDVVQHHGVSGNVYAYKMPEWVIARAGGKHRFDNAGELLISQELWEEAGDEIEFLGKTMSQQDLWDSVDSSYYSAKEKKGRQVKHNKPAKFTWEGLIGTSDPEAVIKMMKPHERKVVWADLEGKYPVAMKGEEFEVEWEHLPGERKGWRKDFLLGEPRIKKREKVIMNLLKKHMKESTIREHTSAMLKEFRLSDAMPPIGLKEQFEAFMSEYESMSESNPIGFHGDRYWTMEEVDGQWCLVMTNISIWDGAIHFGSIHTVPPEVCEGKGYASKVMNQLVELADKHQVPMSLDPKPFGQKTLGVRDLKSWYRRAGFKPNEDRGGEWWRDPK